MIAFCYFIIFFWLFYYYNKKHKGSVGALLLMFYAISALMTLIEFYLGPINNPELDPLATIYYILCVLISLLPFLLLGRYDCNDFAVSEQLLSWLSIILFFFGLIELVTSLNELRYYQQILFNNIAEIRTDFYDSLGGSKKELGFFGKIAEIVHYVQYMSPFCCIYYLTKGRKGAAILMFIASMGAPVRNMTIGEREATLVFISNYAFCLLFFKPAIKQNVFSVIKKIGIVLLAPFVSYVVAMTIGRFSAREGGITEGLLLYGGDEPYFFSYLFNNDRILSQTLGGRLSFRYLFPVSERVQDGINNHISADIYLNQFGGMPGSFLLDFGYYAIIVVLLFALAYYLFIKKTKKNDGKYPFYLLFLFYFSYQVLFMNIFYFDYTSLFAILLSVLFFIASYFSSRTRSSKNIGGYFKIEQVK